ncbi:glycosyltransferase family 2 protein [Candidatus Cetobacterium colombiensis]|uniref:Glycosyltransferase family 2 protein n=1 Tax=Candidatus Cetobacterium colombiensis TaxID=3073100 RepID=A0ABU4W842_9FUSO|nr:glycosyltransferase family 2 protein [Candidatus Cetobacterium colombiensis]MDX8335688.1 glycosyltransferase family 2 protein [Candidatus Cetobacterium colombiensis]
MLSVIIPAYNVEKYIKRCIDSVLNQSLKKIEIIIIDDGSKDKTSDICLEISTKNSNIKYKKVENSGCSAARNLGILMSTNKYIAFLDSDDWVDQDMYEEMIKVAEKNDSDIVICGFKKLNEEKKLLSTVKILEKKNKDDYIDCKTEWFSSPCNKIYKRDLILKNNIKFLTNVYTGEDMFFNFKSLFFSKKISSINEAYYNYFMNESSVSNNYKNRTDIYIVIDELVKFYKENNVYQENINKVRECFKYHGIIYPFDVLQKMSENKVKDWKRFYLKIKEEIGKFKYLETIDIKICYYYRIFRLKMMWLKRYKKMLMAK